MLFIKNYTSAEWRFFYFSNFFYFQEGILERTQKRGDSNVRKVKGGFGMGEYKRTAAIFAVISLVAAFLAALLFLNYVRQAKVNIGDTVEVLVAARDVPAMTVISEDMIKTAMVPKNMAGKFTFTDRKDLINKTVLVNLSAQVIYTAGIIKAGQDFPSNQRVIQLRAPAAVFDGEFKYGDKVDIIVSYKDQEKDVSETLFRNIGVVENIKPSGEEASSLGVVMEETEAEKLVWMLNYGKEVRVIKAG